MTTTLWNGIEIDVPEGWADVSTVVIAPQAPVVDGKKPSINLVVKRRPTNGDETEKSLATYLRFMQAQFGAIDDVAHKEMTAGAHKGKAVTFTANVGGQKLRQTTLLYFASGEEISATVTQRDDDATTASAVEKLLKSVKSVKRVGSRPHSRGAR
jgi:hypothetical protein